MPSPGDSFHNYGLALDVVPTELLALPHWGDNPAHQARTDALWAKVGAIGKDIGFRWGGEFRSIRDRPHFEWTGDLTIANLKRGLTPETPFSNHHLLNNPASKESDHENQSDQTFQDCALRIGSRPTLLGLATVRPALERFLATAVEMGRAGCDLAGNDDFWIAETDISFRGRAGLAPEPCVVSVRTSGRLIKDLRFYIDLAPLATLDL